MHAPTTVLTVRSVRPLDPDARTKHRTHMTQPPRDWVGLLQYTVTVTELYQPPLLDPFTFVTMEAAAPR